MYTPVLEFIHRTLMEEIDDFDDITKPVSVQAIDGGQHQLIRLANSKLEHIEE